VKIVGEKPAADSDAVYQVCLNLFPMSRLEGDK